ncbi:MAG: hypothetical protein JXL97_05450 [Bacteroidales bacterium]|nr:hypothetical protein [Bacteroidales bacterium]
MKSGALILILLIPFALSMEINSEQKSSDSKYIELSIPIIEPESINQTIQEQNTISEQKDKVVKEEKEKLIILLFIILVLTIAYNIISMKYLKKLRKKFKNN